MDATDVQEKKIKCPVDYFCNAILLVPFSKELKKLEEAFKVAKIKSDQNLIPKRQLVEAKHRFCNYHEAESRVIQSGIELGYPNSISFEEIPSRVQNIKPRINQVLQKQVPSFFWKKLSETYESVGIFKAKNNFESYPRQFH